MGDSQAAEILARARIDLDAKDLVRYRDNSPMMRANPLYARTLNTTQTRTQTALVPC